MTNKTNDESIIVLGVGNILLSDEGIGVHLIERLQERYTFKPAIRLLDGGTMGMELLSFMRGCQRLLLLDAIEGKEPPGTVYEFSHQDVERYFSSNLSAHDVGIQDILLITSMLEEPIAEAVVIGIEPESLEVGLEPTPVVAAQLPELERRIINQLARWGVEAARIDE